jgi:hypothetical protein
MRVVIKCRDASSSIYANMKVEFEGRMAKLEGITGRSLRHDFLEWIKTQSLGVLDGLKHCLRLALSNQPMPWEL